MPNITGPQGLAQASAGSQYNFPNPSAGYWDMQVLKDMGVPQSAYGNDLSFLERWTTKETGGGLPDVAHYNLLGNMSGPGDATYGGTRVGGQGGQLLSYSTLEGGAADTANRIKQYGDLNAAFQAGNINPNANYSGLSTWSGGGYSSIGNGSAGNPYGTAGAGGVNAAGAAQAGINNALTAQQIDLQKQLATIDEEYAKVEAGFQNRLLGLQKQGLGISEGALKRQMTEAPLLQADVQRLYQLQFAGIGVQGQGVNEQYRQQLTNMASSGAASGSLFTKGQRDEHKQVMDEWSRATYFLQNQRESLKAQQHQEAVNYLEKLAAYQDQKASYDLTAQKFGIEGEEISQRLTSTLKQTAIGAGETVTSLFQQMLNTDAGLVGNLGSPPLTGGLAAGNNPYVGDPNAPQGSYGNGYPFSYSS